MGTVYAIIIVLAIALVLAMVIFYLVKQKSGYRGKDEDKQKLDERQKAITAKGYRYAYFTLMAYMVLSAILYALHISWCTASIWVLIGFYLSITVYAAYCAFNGAHFNSKGEGLSIRFLMVSGVIFSIIGIARRAITGFAMPLEFMDWFFFYGLHNFVVGICVTIRKALDKREMEE